MNRAYILLSLLIQQQAVAKQLQKVYLHKAPVVHEFTAPAQLEIAKLVFYFNEQPAMDPLTSSTVEDDGWLHEVYVFSDTGVDGSCQKALKQIAQGKRDHYRISCTEIKEPKLAVKIDLYYNPQQVMCCLDSFDAITNHKGVVFRLVNKALLDQLAQQEKPPIRMASAHHPMVIIDCGHGGKDSGTIGCNGVAEKDVTLQVGLELAHLLQQRNYNTYLTRTSDVIVALDERTSFVNIKKPNLYISLHANSSPSKHIEGLETFCLDNRLFKNQHNPHALFQKHMSDLYAQSNRLGKLIHQHLLAYMQKCDSPLIDRKVRHSVCQLLLGTNTPGALVEIGYLSHVQEAVRLTSKSHQRKIAQGICNGILAFITT